MKIKIIDLEHSISPYNKSISPYNKIAYINITTETKGSLDVRNNNWEEYRK